LPSGGELRDDIEEKDRGDRLKRPPRQPPGGSFGKNPEHFLQQAGQIKEEDRPNSKGKKRNKEEQRISKKKTRELKSFTDCPLDSENVGTGRKGGSVTLWTRGKGEISLTKKKKKRNTPGFSRAEKEVNGSTATSEGNRKPTPGSPRRDSKRQGGERGRKGVSFVGKSGG